MYKDTLSRLRPGSKRQIALDTVRGLLKGKAKPVKLQDLFKQMPESVNQGDAFVAISEHLDLLLLDEKNCTISMRKGAPKTTIDRLGTKGE